jgi:general L-amino acid transport system permease protein
MSDAAATLKSLPPSGGFSGSPFAQWAKANLFPNWWSTVVTLVLAYFILKFGFGVLSWSLFNAVWSVENQDTEVCRQLKGVGACWALITEKYRFILFGTYPFQQHWRPTLVILIFLALYGVSTVRSLWNYRLGVI